MLLEQVSKPTADQMSASSAVFPVYQQYVSMATNKQGNSVALGILTFVNG